MPTPMIHGIAAITRCITCRTYPIICPAFSDELGSNPFAQELAGPVEPSLDGLD